MAIHGVLLDLEGVVYQGDSPIPGAAEAIANLAAAGLALRFLTNTTTRPRRAIAARLESLGIAVDPAHIVTPAVAAARLLRDSGAGRIHLAARPALAEDFAGLTLTDAPPMDAVVLGDLYRDFTWDRLDRLFGFLRGGAQLVALHKNRYCRRGDAIALDLGPFVAALEYAAGVEAVVVGKPSADFFAQAIGELGLPADQVLMVGDDIEADIGGARRAGLPAVQVRTGKFTPRDLDHPAISPDGRIDSIADLPEWLAAFRAGAVPAASDTREKAPGM